jgi:hypothetical protein
MLSADLAKHFGKSVDPDVTVFWQHVEKFLDDAQVCL